MKLDNCRQRHLLSFFVILLFGVLAIGSKTNNLHYNAFQYGNSVEEETDKTFLVKNDGTKIYGDKFSLTTGLLVKNTIRIDNQSFPVSEIKAYQRRGKYHIRFKNDYIERIVHGKVNVYVKFTESSYQATSPTGPPRTVNYTRTTHYAQKGEDGPLVGIAGQKDIQKFLADCPLSVQMASLSNNKLRKAVRKERNYMNRIFEVYNNGCKE